MGDFVTVHRADTVASLPALSNTASHIGHLALVADDGSGNVAIRKWTGTVWTAATIGGGSLGVLAGDATGAPGSNTVVKLTGAAGHVAIHAAELTWEEGISSFGISQTNPTAPTTPVGSFFLQLATPHASATGAARNAGIGAFNIPAPTAGGTAGRWQWSVSGAEKFAVEADGVLISGPNVHFAAGVANPGISQDRAVGDVAPQALGISSQTPSLTATGTNLNSPKIIYSIPTPVGVGANGWHEFRIAGTPVFNVEATLVRVGVEQLLWGTSTNFIIAQAPQIGETLAHDFGLSLQIPSGVTGANRNSPTGYFNIPPPNGAGAWGRWVFKHDAQESFAVGKTALVVGPGVVDLTPNDDFSIQPAPSAGSGLGMRIAAGNSTGGVGGGLSLSGGAGATTADAGPVTIGPGGLGTALGVSRLNDQTVVSIGSVNGTEYPAGVGSGHLFFRDATFADTGQLTDGFSLSSAGGAPQLHFAGGSIVKMKIEGSGLQPQWNPLSTVAPYTWDLSILQGGVLYELAIPLVPRQH